MIVINKKTDASHERRVELRNKIERLLSEYEDVPILVAHKIIFENNENQEIMFDFSKGEQENKVNIFIECTFRNVDALNKLSKKNMSGVIRNLLSKITLKGKKDVAEDLSPEKILAEDGKGHIACTKDKKNDKK